MTDYALGGRITPWFTFGADRSLRLVYRNLRAARRYWLVVVSGFFLSRGYEEVLFPKLRD